ncbi:TPA: ISAs1 family transposase, partial [Vibrio vulnificus]|nr:ISAs1 family transposase [Vibrio vulnificus]
LLAAKGSQSKLEEAINDFYRQSLLQDFAEGDSYASLVKGHGRMETGCALVTHDLLFLGDLEYE